MTTNQVWDDDYREPRLEEGVLVNQEDMFGRCQHIHPTNLRMNLRGSSANQLDGFNKQMIRVLKRTPPV